MSNDLSEVIAAHEATNAKLLLRVAELEAECERERMRVVACGVVALANTRESAARAREMHPDYRSSSLGDVERIVDSEMALREQVATLTQQAQAADAALVEAETELDAAKDELATLTQQLETVRESEAEARRLYFVARDHRDAAVSVREAAKADAARLREALEDANGLECPRRCSSKHGGIDNGPCDCEVGDFKKKAGVALSTTDSAAWLESKIAERSSSAVLLVPALEDRIRLHVEREKSLEQQLVAATNDAARAELRLKNLVEACPGLVRERVEAVLTASPDSDERLRAVMNAAYNAGYEDGADLDVSSNAAAWVDEWLGVKS